MGAATILQDSSHLSLFLRFYSSEWDAKNDIGTGLSGFGYSVNNYAKNKAVQSFYKEFSPGKLAKEIVKGVACDFGSKALQIETDYIRYPNYKEERSHG